jgi:hypothetical protein
MNKIKILGILVMSILTVSLFASTYYLLPVTQNNVGSATFTYNPVKTNYNITTNIVSEVVTGYKTNYSVITNTIEEEIIVNVYVTNSVPLPYSLLIEAEDGVIVAPFSKSTSYISQPRETSLSSSGRATYTFNVPYNGNYLVTLRVNAPNEGANSIFLNIDSQPTDPATIFDIPVTSSYQDRTVNWRGNGEYNRAQFIPKVFTLSAGAHTLIIRGREGNTRIDKITIVSQ